MRRTPCQTIDTVIVLYDPEQTLIRNRKHALFGLTLCFSTEACGSRTWDIAVNAYPASYASEDYEGGCMPPDRDIDLIERNQVRIFLGHLKPTYTKKLVHALNERTNLLAWYVRNEREDFGLKVISIGPCKPILTALYGWKQAMRMMKMHPWMPTDFIRTRCIHIPGMHHLNVSTGGSGFRSREDQRARMEKRIARLQAKKSQSSRSKRRV